MNLTLKEMKQVNSVQLHIFHEFIRVCQTLGLKYYMVHGSLLGTIRYQGFFPYDDDIDVAMPRPDYQRFLLEAQSLLPPRYFVQACETEKNYPLPFAKIRDSETAFTQPIMSRFNINQGIYIDVFPIDNYPTNSWKQKYLKFIEIVCGVRISAEMNYKEAQPFWKKALRAISKGIIPSYQKAVKTRALLFSNEIHTGRVLLVGAKDRDRGIPEEWFGKGITKCFESLDVTCPELYADYLTRIYGDYHTYNPAEKYMNPDHTVTVSADKVSVTQSFRAL